MTDSDKIRYKIYNIMGEFVEIKIKTYEIHREKNVVASLSNFFYHLPYKNEEDMDSSINKVFNKTMRRNCERLGYNNIIDYMNKKKIATMEKYVLIENDTTDCDEKFMIGVLVNN